MAAPSVDLKRLFGSARIRTQTILLSAVPAVFLLVVLALSLAVQHVTLESEEWSARSESVLADSRAVMTTLSDASRAITAYVRTSRPSDLTAYRAAAREMPAALRALVRNADDRPSRVLAERLSVLMQRGMDLLSHYVSLQQGGRPAAAKALMARRSTQTLGVAIQRADAAFDRYQEQYAIRHFVRVRGDVQRLEWYLIGSCILGIACSLYMTLRFGLAIVRRLHRLADSARRLGRGQPSDPIGGDDEIAALDRIYHVMTRKIQREHDMAAVLQNALLPQELPKMPGLRIDTAYAPAAREAEIGGDWYDVFTLSETTVGISIGDVAGHGLHAASIMGTARQAIRTAAAIDSDPSRVLYHVNRMACAGSDKTMVTAFFGTLDMITGSLRYAVGGHPMPLAMRPGGNVEILHGRGLMLGVDARATFDTYETILGVGSGLLLYTDGIVETGRDYFEGMARLVDVFRAEYLGSSQNVADAIQRQILADAERRDDTAVLFIGVTELGQRARFRQMWEFDAKEELSTRRVKRALLWHLGELANDQAQISAAELIFGELVSNVARHTPGKAQLTLESSDGAAVLRICDYGEPFEHDTLQPPDLFAESGRGLLLIRAMAQSVVFDRTEYGNRVSAVLSIALGVEPSYGEAAFA